jgi:hypothetical protein
MENRWGKRVCRRVNWVSRRGWRESNLERMGSIWVSWGNILASLENNLVKMDCS